MASFRKTEDSSEDGDYSGDVSSHSGSSDDEGGG
jgi:hypothetical protein